LPTENRTFEAEKPFIVGADGDFQGDLEGNDAPAGWTGGGDPAGQSVSSRSMVLLVAMAEPCS
jgi:hypothetical protein